ncbi:uncharacterized membrane-anchored protein [Methylobacterium sp. 4-46]|uniref:DUF3422 family protein n=1 Tax=unclassified Methylobacterium TaxID=2615210 RepID=UPI000152E088|nr:MULTISPECIES: DUF3422 domain-containing protein [Methylobacterium]ACA17379.1 uncharacterized membrane-anchored protein [Methylobacterium sp. 4-46]WFT83066.1 DUF3422 domain-containing protein [Methylobacterium nodulans]
MRLNEHALRARVLAEVHARPFMPVKTPRRFLHYAFLTDGEAAAADRAALDAYCAGLGLPGPPAAAKQHRVVFSGAILRWESHSEFTTYTWEYADQQGLAFQPQPDALAGPMEGLPQPGDLLVAVDLHLLAAGEGDVPPEITATFSPSSLAVAQAEGGAAVIATDFQADPHGFVRVVVADRGMTRVAAGALVQRVLEIETYRTLALLGLPEAQALGPAIRRIETALPVLMEEMRASEGFEANHQLLDRLIALSAELEAGAARSLFRFGATRAYDELIRLRLDAIREQPIPGQTSWSVFLARRFNPAIRTCMATGERQDTLSEKLSRAAQMLRTRVDVELEKQNHAQLQAMNDRVRLQIRLQQTVEGLSVAAISYYVASLVHHVLEGAHAAGLPVDATIGTAAAVPAIVLAVAWTVRRIRRRHAEGEAG